MYTKTTNLLQLEFELLRGGKRQQEKKKLPSDTKLAGSDLYAKKNKNL